MWSLTSCCRKRTPYPIDMKLFANIILLIILSTTLTQAQDKFRCCDKEPTLQSLQEQIDDLNERAEKYNRLNNSVGAVFVIAVAATVWHYTTDQSGDDVPKIAAGAITISLGTLYFSSSKLKKRHRPGD